MQIDVIIPVKNGAEFIGEAIASALRQTGVRRVVVVDDGSTDGSGDVAARIEDERVFVVNGGARGVSAARNRGFAETERSDAAEDGWVIFLDADDRLTENATKRLLDAATDDCVAVYGNYERIDREGHPIGRRSLLSTRQKPSGDVLRQMLSGNFIVNSGAMAMRKSAYRQSGGFDESLRYCEDWHLFCRLASLGPFAWCPGTPVMEYRVHGTSTMMNAKVDFGHYRAALDRVFTDPMIVGNVPRDEIRTLHKKAEAHLKTYLACQAIRAGSYVRALKQTAEVITLLPARMPKTLAHTFGALVGL